MEKSNKPIIESIINTVALALTAYGVAQVTIVGSPLGYVAIVVGLIIEFAKYYGRSKELW